MARPFTATYASSKGGVIGLTREMAGELALAWGETAMSELITKQACDMFKIDDPQIIKNTIIDGIPLERAVTTDDIAYAVLYLASDESSMITGDNLMLDGGSRV